MHADLPFVRNTFDKPSDPFEQQNVLVWIDHLIQPTSSVSRLSVVFDTFEDLSVRRRILLDRGTYETKLEIDLQTVVKRRFLQL